MGTSSRSYISGIDPAKRVSLPAGVVPLMTTASRRFGAHRHGRARKPVRRSQFLTEAYGRVGVQRRPNLPDVHGLNKARCHRQQSAGSSPPVWEVIPHGPNRNLTAEEAVRLHTSVSERRQASNKRIAIWLDFYR